MFAHFTLGVHWRRVRTVFPVIDMGDYTNIWESCGHFLEVVLIFNAFLNFWSFFILFDSGFWGQCRWCRCVFGQIIGAIGAAGAFWLCSVVFSYNMFIVQSLWTVWQGFFLYVAYIKPKYVIRLIKVYFFRKINMIMLPIVRLD